MTFDQPGEDHATGPTSPSVPGIRVLTFDPTCLPPGTASQAAAILSEEELEKASCFRFMRHRQQYLAAHLLKRAMLAQELGLEPRELRFVAGEAGKPYLAEGPDCWFNLSHCDGLVACAVSRTVQPGVDVEPLEREAPLDVAGSYFAPEEYRQLFGLPEQLRAERFFALWTLKEAFIKSTGLGLSQGLHSFAIGFDPLRVTFADPGAVEPGRWNFAQQRVGDGHLLALAWRGADVPVAVETATLDQLLACACRAGSERAGVP